MAVRGALQELDVPGGFGSDCNGAGQLPLLLRFGGGFAFGGGGAVAQKAGGQGAIPGVMFLRLWAVGGRGQKKKS